MNQQSHGERPQRQSFESFPNSANSDFNFDLWALAVRRQMLASLKKREGHRINWE